MKRLKAPETGWSSSSFYEKYRDVVGKSLVDFVQEFFRNGKLIR